MKREARETRKVFTQYMHGIDRDIVRCGELHARIKIQLATVKKDSAFRA